MSKITEKEIIDIVISILNNNIPKLSFDKTKSTLFLSIGIEVAKQIKRRENAGK